MVDLVRFVAIAAVLVAAIRAGHRLGAGIAVAIGLLLIAEVSLPFVFPRATTGAQAAFGAVFLGPSALPHEPPWALTAVLLDPVHHVAPALAAGAGAASALGRAARLPPDGQASRRLDLAGLRLLALAVLHGLLSVSGMLQHLLGGEI